MKKWWITIIILFLIMFFCFELIEQTGFSNKIKSIFYSQEPKEKQTAVSLQIVRPEET